MSAELEHGLRCVSLNAPPVGGVLADPPVRCYLARGHTGQHHAGQHLWADTDPGRLPQPVTDTEPTVEAAPTLDRRSPAEADPQLRAMAAAGLDLPPTLTWDGVQPTDVPEPAPLFEDCPACQAMGDAGTAANQRAEEWWAALTPTERAAAHACVSARARHP